MRLCVPDCHAAAVGILNNRCAGLCEPVADLHAAHADALCQAEPAAGAPLPYLPSHPEHRKFETLRV